MMKIDSAINHEAKRLSQKYNIPDEVFECFAKVVICRVKPPKPATINQLKKAIYKYFKVSNTDKLKKSESFKMATDGMGKLNLGRKASWEKLYREFIGVLPHEEWELGHGCINGVNIFKYALPWRVFELDPKTSTDDDVKASYRNLSKFYHPDNPETGDTEVFERINQFYRTLTASA